jgi:hypothetical protein
MFVMVLPRSCHVLAMVVTCSCHGLVHGENMAITWQERGDNTWQEHGKAMQRYCHVIAMLLT